MKANKDCKIEAVVSRDASRPGIGFPYFRGGALWATDGRAMVKLPVESDETDKEGWVPVDALKAARKLAGRLDTVSIHLNGAATLCNGAVFPRPGGDQLKGAQWPNCERVFDDAMGKETKLSIALNVRLLAAIADAMGTDEVKLDLTDEWTVIRVSPVGKVGKSCCLGARGIFAPIRTV